MFVRSLLRCWYRTIKKYGQISLKWFNVQTCFQWNHCYWPGINTHLLTIHHIRTMCIYIYILYCWSDCQPVFSQLFFFFLVKIYSTYWTTAEEWNLHRRLIQPTFHVNTLEQFLGTFIDASNVLVQRLKDGSSQLNVTHLVNQCVIDILNGTVNQRYFQFFIQSSRRKTICWFCFEFIYFFV